MACYCCVWMPWGVRIFEEDFVIGGVAWLGRRSGSGSTCRGRRRRGCAEIAGPFVGAVFEWSDRRASAVDDWDFVLHLRAGIWPGHLYAAQGSSGASLDAGDLGA